MLEFGMKRPFSYDNFLKNCEEQLSFSDMEIIKDKKYSPLLKGWKSFDTTLRNEIVKFRAHKKSIDPHQYIRGENLQDPFIAKFVHWVTNEQAPFEAEISLDRYRWEKIEELSRGHYFDIDFLVAYALKLKILERWEKINSLSGIKVLEELVA